jgi:hypothetical protein
MRLSMKALLAAIVVLCGSPALAAAVYPCKIAGIADPVLCYGTEKLVPTYTGNALTAQKQSTTATQAIGFTGDGMNTTALDVFIASDTYAGVIAWNDQIGGCDAIANATVQVPWIGKSVNVGTKRSIVFPGGTHLGNAYGLDIPSSCLSAKGITAKDYTVFMVVRPTSSMYRTQAFTPGLGSGTFLSLESSQPVQITGDTTAGVPTILNANPVAGLAAGMVVSSASNGPFPQPVLISSVVGTTVTLSGANALTTGTGTSILASTPNTRIYANGNATPGGIGVSDNFNFTLEPTDAMLETGPMVIAVASNSTGVRQWQNEVVRGSATRSGRDVTSSLGFIGRMGLSQQVNLGVAGSCQANPLPCGPYSLAGDYYAVAVLVYNYGMTDRQRATISNALYDRFGISPNQNHSRASVTQNFILAGDSIPSGYNAFGTYGMAQRLQDLMPGVRFGNYSVPGSQLTASVGTPNYGYTAGMFPLSIAPVMAYSKGKNVFFLLGGGNDMIDQNSLAGSISVASPAVVTRVAHGMSSGMRMGATGTLPSPLSAGTIYYVKNVLSPDTYTIAATPSGAEINTTGSSSGITILQYTKTAAQIFAGIQNIVSQAVAAGATKVFVSTVLPRTGNPYLFVLDDTNTLIRAGAGGNYTLVDLAVVSCLSDPTGACYNDGTHPSDLGHQAAANAMFGPVSSYFGP